MALSVSLQAAFFSPCPCQCQQNLIVASQTPTTSTSPAAKLCASFTPPALPNRSTFLGGPFLITPFSLDTVAGPSQRFCAGTVLANSDGEVRKTPLQSRRPQPIPQLKIAPEPPPVFVFDEHIPKKRLDRSLPRRTEESFDELLGLRVPTMHRSGYVAIIGRPNAGKSTLLNQLIGQKLSIVTKKPQTTRHRILGICSGRDYQMVLYDTPGVMLKRVHKLDEVMMHNVRSAAVNADCVVLVVDITLEPEEVVGMLEEAAAAATEKRPLLLVLNKRDLLKPGEIAKKILWYTANSQADDVVAVSAKYGHGCEELRKWAIPKLPLGPAYYPKDIVSEHPERFFVSEIVREKILLQYHKEIPYVCQVNVLNYVERESPNKDFIELEIVVERESQKAILVGKDGKALKTLATAARLDIEDFVGRPVFIEVVVKVKDNWRENEKLLQEFGIDGRRKV